MATSRAPRPPISLRASSTGRPPSTTVQPGPARSCAPRTWSLRRIFRTRSIALRLYRNRRCAIVTRWICGPASGFHCSSPRALARAKSRRRTGRDCSSPSASKTFPAHPVRYLGVPHAAGRHDGNGSTRPLVPSHLRHLGKIPSSYSWRMPALGTRAYYRGRVWRGHDFAVAGDAALATSRAPARRARCSCISTTSRDCSTGPVFLAWCHLFCGRVSSAKLGLKTVLRAR